MKQKALKLIQGNPEASVVTPAPEGPAIYTEHYPSVGSNVVTFVIKRRVVTDTGHVRGDPVVIYQIAWEDASMSLPREIEALIARHLAGKEIEPSGPKLVQ